MKTLFQVKDKALDGARFVSQVLQDNGYKAVIVGGAVRDALRGETPKDFDLATSATPQQCEALFKRTIAIGKRFGTITVSHLDYEYQVTTFRSEKSYSDHRHPDNVTFETNLDADLSRRDFTINAMAYDVIQHKLTDNFEGQQHLNDNVLVTVGNAHKRFKEDSLRLFRACRFMSQLNCKGHLDLVNALFDLGSVIALPSKERIHIELHKCLMGPFALRGLFSGIESGLFQRILPGIELMNDLQWTHVISEEGIKRWAALLSYCETEQCFKYLAFSKKEREWIKKLIEFHGDEKKATFTVKDLKITVNQLQEMGFFGRNLGEVQQACMYFVLDDLSCNTVDGLKTFINTQFKKNNKEMKN